MFWPTELYCCNLSLTLCFVIVICHVGHPADPIGLAAAPWEHEGTVAMFCNMFRSFGLLRESLQHNVNFSENVQFKNLQVYFILFDNI